MPDERSDQGNPNNAAHWPGDVRPFDWEDRAAIRQKLKREAGAFELAANLAAARTEPEKKAMGRVMVMVERVTRSVLGSSTHVLKAGSFLKHTYVVGLSDLDVCVETKHAMTKAQKKELSAAFKQELSNAAAVEKNKTIRLVTECGFVDIVPLRGEFLPGGVNFEPRQTFLHNPEGQQVVRMLKVYAAKHSLDWSGYKLEHEVLRLQCSSDLGQASSVPLYHRARAGMEAASGYTADSSSSGSGSGGNDGSSLDDTVSDALSDASTVLRFSAEDEDLNSCAYFLAVAEHFMTSIRARKALERLRPTSAKINSLARLNELKQAAPPMITDLCFHQTDSGFGGGVSEFSYVATCTVARGPATGRNIDAEGRGPSKKAAKVAAGQRLLDHIALKPILPSQ